MSETRVSITPEIESPKKLSPIERQQQVIKYIENAKENGLYSYLLKICGRILEGNGYPNDIEDMVIETLLKACKASVQFEEKNASTIKTWVTRIATNTCLSFLKKRRVRKETTEADLPEHDTLGIGNSMLIADPNSMNGKSLGTVFENHDLVLKLLEGLTPEERELILLKKIKGLSIKELAKATGQPINTIKVKLYRARQKMIKAAKRLSKITNPNKA